MVDPESATLNHSCERADFIDSDHMAMCKFYGKDDDGYQKVTGEIRRHVKRLRYEAGVDQQS